MAQLLDNVLDSLQQKLETQLDSAVGIDLKTDRETESDEDEPADVKALRARVKKAEADAKALLDEGADLSTKLCRADQRNKTLRAELADRERVIARLESRGGENVAVVPSTEMRGVFVKTSSSSASAPRASRTYA